MAWVTRLSVSAMAYNCDYSVSERGPTSMKVAPESGVAGVFGGWCMKVLMLSKVNPTDEGARARRHRSLLVSLSFVTMSRCCALRCLSRRNSYFQGKFLCNDLREVNYLGAG